MQLKAQALLAVSLLVGCTACGPDTNSPPDPADWMLGWFSTASLDADVAVDFASLYHLQGDGTLTLWEISGCNQPGDDAQGTERQWEVEDGDTLRMTRAPDSDSNGASSIEAWLIRRLPECAPPGPVSYDPGGDTTFELVSILEGEEYERVPLYSGKLCVSPGEAPEGCHGNCTVCYKSWCEGEEPLVSCDDGT
jgi:hypothetical protein